MSTTAGDLIYKLEADVSGFNKALDQASGRLDKLEKQGTTATSSTGSSFLSFSKKVATAATAVAGVGAAMGVGFVKSAIQSSASLEQNRIAFETMLGSAEKAGQVLKDITTFASTTPFELPEIQDSARSLLAFGVAAEDLQPSLKAIGDIASGVGAPIGELAELYGKAKTQGRLFAEDINQLTGRGIPIIQELAKQFGVTEGEVKKLVESGEVGFEQLELGFQNMSGEGGQFYNLMEKQSKSFSGVISNLKDNFGLMAKAIVGIDPEGNIQPGGLFDQFKGLAEQLLTVLNDNKQTIIDVSKNALQGLFEALKTVGNMIVKVAGFYKAHDETIKIVAATVAGLAVTFTTLQTAMSFVALIKNMNTAFSALGVGGASVLALLALAIATVYGEWRTLKDDMDKAAESTKTLKEQNEKLKEQLDGVTDPARRAQIQGIIDSNNQWVASAESLEARYDGVLGKLYLIADKARESISSGIALGGVFASAGLPSGATKRSGLNTGGMIGASGQILRFAEGGMVPGSGNSDSVLAALTPGEFVLNPNRGQGLMKVEVNFNNATIRQQSDLEDIKQTIRQTLSRDIELTEYGVF